MLLPANIPYETLQSNIEECIQDLSTQFEILGLVRCGSYLSYIDFYLEIKKLHREVFADNQRIIFVITEDTPALTNLTNLQVIINDVDISNFFVCLVSTNPDLLLDYQQVFQSHSRDSIPFRLYQCSGDYKKISYSIPTFSKYTSVSSITEKINSLRDDQKKLLFESKTFCMLAWAGINVYPDNRVGPCCEFKGSVGDTSKDSLKVIWNSEHWKKTRRYMLDGIPVDSCQACYQKESIGRDTLRKSANRSLIDSIGLVDHTRDDGYLDKFQLSYWDIRYNNLCNLSCRSCNPGSSSSWYQPALSIGKITQPRSAILIAGQSENDLFDQIIQHIDHVKQIYFAGGEPSMIDKFYEILELLDARGRNDVSLTYNINMSRLNLKDKSLLRLWKKFPHVSIGASLDGEFKRGEYLRQGLVWDDVVKNRTSMIAECPHVDFYISATVSILNVLHLPEFHKSWIDQGLIKPADFNVQMLFEPGYLRIDKSPPELKEKIKDIYQSHLEWLVPRDELGRATYGFRSVISFMENEQHKFDAMDFWSNIDKLDRYYKTNMSDIFPELDFLPR